MQTNYAEALVEVNEILKFTDPNLTKKIPEKFKKYIADNMSSTYKFNITDDFSNDHLKSETKSILALIYRNYFCSAEEKNFLIYKEKLEKNSSLQQEAQTEKIETNIKVKNFDEIFSNPPSTITSTSNVSETETTLELVEYKEKWYITLLEKLLNKLKSI